MDNEKIMVNKIDFIQKYVGKLEHTALEELHKKLPETGTLFEMTELADEIINNIMRGRK